MPHNLSSCNTLVQQREFLLLRKLLVFIELNRSGLVTQAWPSFCFCDESRVMSLCGGRDAVAPETDAAKLKAVRTEADRMKHLAQFFPPYLSKEKQITHFRKIVPTNGHGKMKDN